jgi:hypothetical protein
LVCSIVIFEIKLLISDTLLESLASAEKPCRAMKEISQRMARIAITTMSSTKVKAHFELKVKSLKLKGVKVLRPTPLSPNPFSPDPRNKSEDDIRVEGEASSFATVFKVLKSKPPSPNPFLLGRRQGKEFVAPSFPNVFPFPVSPFGRDKREGLPRGKELRIGV